jgi:hypothetical protein
LSTDPVVLYRYVRAVLESEGYGSVVVQMNEKRVYSTEAVGY